MSAIRMNIVDLHPFIDSQISRINRYSSESEKETLTIVFIKAEIGTISEIVYMLQDNLRDADVIFHKDDYFFLVLPETDSTGGLHIEEVLKEFLDRKDLSVGIATLPEDGKTKESLLDSLQAVCQSSFNIDLKDYIY